MAHKKHRPFPVRLAVSLRVAGLMFSDGRMASRWDTDTVRGTTMANGLCMVQFAPIGCVGRGGKIYG